MKRQLTILLATFILLTTQNALSQSEASQGEMKIDPRQYVTVQYRKTPVSGKLDTIWNWETRKNVANQKFHYIDVDGEIKIDFNRLGLTNNTAFEGTVSLEAEISGPNGTRKIEVNPYSEIGIQRIPIGIKAEPASEIAKKVINMISELKDVDSYNNTGYYNYYFNSPSIPANKILRDKLQQFDSLAHIKNFNTKDLKSIGNTFKKLVKTEFDLIAYDYQNELIRKWDSTLYFSNTNEDIQAAVDGIFNEYNGEYIAAKKRFIDHYKPAFDFCKERLGLIISYLTSFDNSGEDAVKSFLSLINKDYINYSALKTKFLSYKDELDKIKFNSNNPDSAAIVIADNTALLSQTLQSLIAFSRFKGSELESILRDLAKRKQSELMSDTSYARYYNKSSSFRDTLETKFFFSLLDTYRDELSDILSKAAGKIIFRKLVYATIDLGKAGAKSDEVLTVYVTWILDSKKDSLGNSPRLPIGKYYLRETGWKFEVADMFAMVKRVGEAKVADQTKVSPSNFKGSGGAVLMFTYK